MRGTWKTESSGIGAVVIVVGAVVVGALIYQALKSAAQAFGDFAAVGVAAGIALAVGAGGTFAVMRLRGHRLPVRQQHHPAIAEAFAREHAHLAAAAERRAITQAQRLAPVIAATVAALQQAQPQPEPVHVITSAQVVKR